MNGGYVSAATKARVQRAIRDLGYAPSSTARNLVTGQRNCIGVVASSTQSAWFSHVLAGIEDTLTSTRSSVLCGSLVLEGSYDASTIAGWISDRRVGGLIFICYTRREHELLAAATAAGLPVVLVGPSVKAAASSIIRCDNVEAGRLAGHYLLGLGHKRIAFAGGPRQSIDTRDRHRGLLQALLAARLELPERRVWFGPHFGVQSGVDYAHAFLALPLRHRPSAVVMGNDVMALGFMRTLLEQGVKIPGDVSVVGFDGIPEGALYWPGLTTVAQPARHMGARACQALLDVIEDADLGARIEYGMELIIRESTAPLEPGR